MKYRTLLLFVLVISSLSMNGSDTARLLLLLKATKRTAPVITSNNTIAYSTAHTWGMGILLTGITALGYLNVIKKLKQDSYDPQDCSITPVPESMRPMLYQLLLECGFDRHEADKVELCLQVLPKNVYGYADCINNRIVLNAQWCLLGNTYSGIFDKVWSRCLSWWVAPGFKFIFCHEALHLKKHAKIQSKSESMDSRTRTLLYEMEADLGALDVLLKHSHWRAIIVSMGKIAFDAFYSVPYSSSSPSAIDRYRCWKRFCLDFIRKKNPSYQDYAHEYIDNVITLDGMNAIQVT